MIIRPITRDDWDKILEFRNTSYKYFQVQNKTLTKKEHYDYMERQENNPNYHGYIYDDKVFVRLLNGDISVMVLPKFRNKGYATKALLEFIKIHPNFFASIDIRNTASFKLFLKISESFS